MFTASYGRALSSPWHDHHRLVTLSNIRWCLWELLPVISPTRIIEWLSVQYAAIAKARDAAIAKARANQGAR